MLNLILWAILGSVTCLIASAIIGGERSWITNSIICIIGAFAGYIVMCILNAILGITGFAIYSFLIALIGAFALLLLLNYSYNSGDTKKFSGKKKRPVYAYTRGQETYKM